MPILIYPLKDKSSNTVYVYGGLNNMVGMNQMKKKMVVGIVIGAAIGVVGIGLTLWWAITTINSYKEGTNKEYNRLYTQDVAVL